MTSAEQGPVVAGFDGSAQARRAIGWAAREAMSLGRRLLIVTALPTPVPDLVFTPVSAPVPDVFSEDVVREQAEKELAAVAADCGQRWPDLEVATRLEQGRLAEVVDDGAGLLVVGASGRSALTRALLGSTSADVVHHHERTVVVRGENTAGKVVVGVDGSERGGHAVAFAFDFAARHGRELVAVHAWADLPLDSLSPVRTWDYDWEQLKAGSEAVLEEALAPHRKAHPDVDVRQLVSFDGPAHALIEEAADAALLVLGSHGRGAVRRALLGSVSHAVLYHAHCSVAVIRG
ncbi:universal stress protein [Lentzea tibetensis]|uniref:Universal stress protein n=1 Tax=Lentzea tibetensis TaxID=2591470 RepID=A0A563ESQ5_9PSEU|nr:universal stress protein [Lentzea tibetensis]TWP50737.1 universal stress protein [Lentzea tibetensis]